MRGFLEREEVCEIKDDNGVWPGVRGGAGILNPVWSRVEVGPAVEAGASYRSRPGRPAPGAAGLALAGDASGREAEACRRGWA